MTPSHSPPDLVGRNGELERLGKLFDEVAGGRATTVLVAGDAGIGKSRLVEEFCDRARLRGAVVATGLCVPSEGGLPYAPVMGILRTLGRQVGQSSPAQLLSTLGADVGRDGSAALDPLRLSPAGVPTAAGFARTVFFESILETLAEAAQRSPIVLVFEDLHWADSGSTQLVDFLTRNFDDLRVLILGTYRGEDLDPDHALTPWLTELARHPRVTRLDLGGLERADLATLIEARTGRLPDSLLLDSVWTRSQGNPFYAEELLASPDTAPLPRALRDVIMSRVRDLAPQAQQLLTVAAVAGVTADHHLLARLSRTDADQLSASISETVDKNILVVDASRSGYVFRHALLREAVYDALLPSERIRMHLEIARALSADPALVQTAPNHRAAELAAHWWAAEEWAATLQPSLDAVGAAVAVGAFPEALTLLEHALTSAERAPDAAAAAHIDRLKLLEQGADLAYLAGAHERAVDFANALIAGAHDRSDPLTAARGYTLLGRNLWCTGDSATAFRAYRSAEGLLGAATPSVELAVLLAEEAHWYILMSRWVAGAERAQEALDQARAVGARQVEGSALNTLGCCRVSLGFEDEGIALLRDSLVIAEETSDPEGLIHAYRNLAAMLLDASRLDEAVSIMFDGAARGEDPWGLRLSGASINGVEALVRLGRWTEAEQVLRRPRPRAFGPHASWDWRQTLAGPMMIRRGHFEAARGVLAAEREMTSGLYDVMGAAAVLGMFAELELELGRPDVAESHAQEALALAVQSDDESMLPEFCMWGARAIADQYDRNRANCHQPDRENMRMRCDDFVAAVHRTVLARQERGVTLTPRSFAAEAQSAAERSRLDRSDTDLWDQAALLWEEAREPYPRAYCRWRQAEALLESRAGRARARECLHEAWRISTELGTEPLTARILGLAQRGRLQLHDTEEAVPTTEAMAAADLGLTVREVEILGQLAAGRSDREIGELLFISKKTVSVHVSNVLRKLEVSNRVAAGKIGHAHGLAAPFPR
ncbi:MAG: hypothetical protein QOJ11_3595 [Frankiales bacterium]|jgi:DNA-binding CsgD family transcriptional regulator|nr:hypothetical protein [Frankiales bacterium]